MASLMIVTRKAKDGPRYAVRYRLGGRTWPVVHAGSFRTWKEARARRDLVAGEIAAGRNPQDLLGSLLAPVERKQTVDQWAEKFIASRIDIDANTTKNYRSALKKAGMTFGDRDPFKISVDDVAGWVRISPRSTSRERCSCTCCRSACCSTTARAIRTPLVMRA